MKSNNSQKKISMIGLGQMGKKIAEMFIGKEYDVTVWNRTAVKASELNASSIAKDVEEALASSSVSIICVLDNTAVTEILMSIPNKAKFAGKTIINFTTGTTEEVKKLESWLGGLGATYLNGAIQVAPDQMGLPDTTILTAGNKKAFDSCKEIMAVLGGNVKFLGEHASASPAMDLATLSWVYASFVGMIYGVALCESEGIKLEDYSTVLGDIAPSFLDFFKHEINTIRENNFNITQSPLSISVIASQRITDAVRSIGLDAAFTDEIATILRKAKDKGYENEEVSAIIKIIRNRPLAEKPYTLSQSI